MKLGLLLIVLLGAGGAQSSVEAILRLAEEGRVSEAMQKARRARLAPVDRDQILGYLALKAGRTQQARDLLAAVVERAPERHAAWLYLGISEHRLGNASAAVAALGRAGSAAEGRAGYFALKARNERLTGAPSAAFETLRAGLERFEDSPGLLREQVSILLRAELYGPAVQRAERLLEVSAHPLADGLKLARELIEADALKPAASLLESLRLRLPTEEKIAGQLAWIYAQLGRHRSAARLIDPARLGSATWAHQAADQYRLSEEWDAALRCNRSVSDAKQARSQRLVILLESGAFERAAAFGAGFEPDALEPRGRFALAWASLNTGRPERAAVLVKSLESHRELPGLDALQSALEDCRRDPTRCP